MNEDNKLGSYIKNARKSKKLSIVKLSDLSGVSNPYISQLENGKFKPSPDILRKLSDALELDYFYLMFLAGYYSLHEMMEKRNNNFFTSMTPKERDNYDKKQKNEYLLHIYKEEMYPELDKKLKQGGNLFFKKHNLTQKDRDLVYKILDALFEEREKDYPTKEEIEEAFEVSQRISEGIKKLSEMDDSNG